MKALSVKQPWAWAIFHAGKDIENRKYYPSVTGTIAIHVSTKMDPVDWLPAGVRRPKRDELEKGVIIGVVDVVEAVQQHPSKWRVGSYKYGWILKNPRLLVEPIPYPGRTYLWDVPPGIGCEINRQLSR